MGIKRLIGLVAVLAGVLAAIIFLRNRAGDVDTDRLHILVWSNYFSEKALARFTEQTGIRVEQSFMSSNEEVFAKLKAGATGFDIIQPSDYMVRRMGQLAMLAPLEANTLTNLGHLDDYFKHLPYDPNFQYSVPFTWGTSGIAINTEKIKVPEDGVGWKMLYESPDWRHTSLLDDMREVFCGFLKLKGFSSNTRDLQILRNAKSEIGRVKTKILTFTSEPKALLLKGEVNIAHIFSTDGIASQAQLPKIKYFIPKEGATIWTDNLAIPVQTKRRKQAHVFIDYFLDPENVMESLIENHLATPNKTAKLRLPEEIQKDPSIYPTPEIFKRLEFLEEEDETLQEMNKMWTELKT